MKNTFFVILTTLLFSAAAQAGCGKNQLKNGSWRLIFTELTHRQILDCTMTMSQNVSCSISGAAVSFTGDFSKPQVNQDCSFYVQNIDLANPSNESVSLSFHGQLSNNKLEVIGDFVINIADAPSLQANWLPSEPLGQGTFMGLKH